MENLYCIATVSRKNTLRCPVNIILPGISRAEIKNLQFLVKSSVNKVTLKAFIIISPLSQFAVKFWIVS